MYFRRMHSEQKFIRHTMKKKKKTKEKMICQIHEIDV